MQTALLKLLLLSSTLSLVAPLSEAKRLAIDTCGGRQCQMKLQGVVLSSVVPKQIGLPHQAAFLQPTSKAASVPVFLQPDTTDADKSPGYSLRLIAKPVSSPGVEPPDQIVSGLSFGSVLSAGSAQQSVNQEGVRDKPAKQDAANGDSTKQNSRGQQTRNKDARPMGSVGGKPNIEFVGESGNGSTASGAAEAPSRRPRVQENW